MSGERYLCIHGHFYQPPRENPWLEEVEMQDSAYPYHDWNDRITAECYEPNAAARMLDGEDRIVRLVNNYARISFNFGPTLLKWLEDHEPLVYEAILEADAQSVERFSGHGSAMAQAYNHMIVPLSNERDRKTQLTWGVKDFEHRFGRRPEGMWLPETAVDTATLELMASLGIRYTILAPHQAARARKIGETKWQEFEGAQVDPTRAYRAVLPSKRELAVFFYDGPISRAVAFEGLLSRGETFAERLVTAFDDGRTWPQLAHIATDGETYGHHHRRGEMALAYALEYIESRNLATLTNYGEYLERFPPEWEAEVVDNTSWSCVHGVERWRSDCGCNSGGGPGWNQQWRAPLRAALDWLRDEAASGYEREGAKLFSDPWAARDDYIDVILDRSEESMGRFFSRHSAGELNEQARVRALKLLELQRHAMLMYTSCGWFFDELSGIETTQVIQYAGRVVQLAGEVLGADLEPEFLRRLAEAKSNIPEQGDGASIYRRHVKPSMVDLQAVAAHFALSSLFADYEPETRIYAYEVSTIDRSMESTGASRLLLGHSRVTSVVTRESAEMSYGILHFGDHNVSGGVRPYMGPEAYRAMTEEIRAAYEQADFPQVIRLQDKHFEGAAYSLKSLFRDEQRKVLSRILDTTLESVEATYRDLYEQHRPLMQSLKQFDYPLPVGLRTAAEAALHREALVELGQDRPDFERLAETLEQADHWGIRLDGTEMPFAMTVALERLAGELEEHPQDRDLLGVLIAASDMAEGMGDDIDRWTVQKAYYRVGHAPVYAEMRSRADRGDAEAREWLELFRTLGGRLRVLLPD